MDNDEDSDFHDFHLRVLTDILLPKNGLQAAKASRELVPLCFRLANTDNAYTFFPRAETIDIVAGTEGDITVELDYRSWVRFIKNPLFATNVQYKKHHYRQNEDLKRWERVFKLMFQTG